MSELQDGRLAIAYFAAIYEAGICKGNVPRISFSSDGGRTWTQGKDVVMGPKKWACSAPVRQLSSGRLILAVYESGMNGGTNRNPAVILSDDGGRTWCSPIRIAVGPSHPGGHSLNETDLIEVIRDGTSTVLAIMRSCGSNMQCAISKDGGQSWALSTSLGFMGHAPHLLRHSSGAIVLSMRHVRANGTAYGEWLGTSVRVSEDDGKTWSDAGTVSTAKGGYAASVELFDGKMLCISYQEDSGSKVQGDFYTISGSRF